MTHIALAIPTRRRNDYLRKLLDSVRTSGFEVVVRDNGAGASMPIRSEYPWVRWCDGPELSMYESWNACLRLAGDAEIVALPSDDDLYVPGAGEAVREAILRFPMADLYVFGHNVIGADGAVLSSWAPQAGSDEAPRGFLRFVGGVDARMPSIFIRSTLLRKIGLLDTSFRVTAADSQWIHRALLAGRAVFSPVIVSSYRVWPGGATDRSQFTIDWLVEVDKWSSSIAPMAAEALGRVGCAFRAASFRDELYGSNVVAALSRAVSQGRIHEVWPFLKRTRLFFHARAKTQMRFGVALGRWAMIRLLSRKSRASPR